MASTPGTILVVDDEVMLRQMVARILSREGYSVFEAGDGLAACEEVRRLGGKISLIITDILMPRMSGPEMIEILHREYPDIPVLCISAYADPRPREAPNFLPKPFAPAALLALVRSLTGSHCGTPGK